MPWLTILWAVPMVGAVAGDAASRRRSAHWPSGWRWRSRWWCWCIAVVVAVGFEPGGAQYQFVEDHAWIPSFGTGYILGLDGIALALVC